MNRLEESARQAEYDHGFTLEQIIAGHVDPSITLTNRKGHLWDSLAFFRCKHGFSFLSFEMRFKGERGLRKVVVIIKEKL